MQCPFCQHEGVRRYAGGGLGCPHCGRVIRRAPGETCFANLEIGECFLSAYDPEGTAEVLLKVSDEMALNDHWQRRWMGPLAPVIPLFRV